MADLREKTISYRRAEWIDASGITLEWCIREAHRVLRTIDDWTIGYGGHLTRSAKQRNVTGGGLLLHLTTETPGEAASVVPHPKPTSREIDLGTANPPNF